MGEVTLKGFQCERCRHIWVPREEESPRVCPKCKSPYWDRPRKSVKMSNRDLAKRLAGVKRV